MGYGFSKVLGVFLAPGALLFLGLAVGSAVLWSRRWRRGRALLTVLAVVFGIFATLPIDTLLTRTLENRFPAMPDLPAKVDGIIILGGAVDQYISQARHQISLNSSADRLFEAARLARRYPEARVIYSGGSADPFRPELKEAPYGGQVLVEMGVDPARLVLEDLSRNTYENAVFSQRMADPGRGQVWLLITSARHMPRAVGVFRQVGWPVIPWPVDYTTDGAAEWVNMDLPVARLSRLTQALHEWVGLVFYRLSGWTDSLFPAP